MHKCVHQTNLCARKSVHANIKFVEPRISLIKRKTFGHLDLVLKAIMQNSSPFGEVSFLFRVDFLQLPPVNQMVFIKPSKGSYRSFNGWLWEKIQLHELIEIVWQSNDPDYAQLIGLEKVSKQIMT